MAATVTRICCVPKISNETVRKQKEYAEAAKRIQISFSNFKLWYPDIQHVWPFRPKDYKNGSILRQHPHRIRLHHNIYIQPPEKGKWTWKKEPNIN